MTCLWNFPDNEATQASKESHRTMREITEMLELELIEGLGIPREIWGAATFNPLPRLAEPQP